MCSMKEGSPLIGRYSLVWVGSLANNFSASLTTGSGKGLPSAVLKAPTPMLTFKGLVSCLKSAVSLKIATGGQMSTFENVEGALVSNSIDLTAESKSMVNCKETFASNFSVCDSKTVYN